jgi:hypothetical protein
MKGLILLVHVEFSACQNNAAGGLKGIFKDNFLESNGIRGINDLQLTDNK